MAAWHPPSETARRPGKRRKIKRSGETPRRRHRLWPSAPGFGYNEALPEQYDPAKFPKKPPATDALSPMGQKSSLMQTFAQARTLPLRPHQYSAMPLPALPINAPRRTCVPRGLPCGFVLAMSDLQSFQPPRMGYPARSFYCIFCIISIPSSHLPAQKKRRGLKCSRAKQASRAALPCGFVLALSLTDNQTHLFFALSALFPAPPTHPSGTKKAPGLQMQALQTCASRALLIGFIIAMSLTDDQTCLFIALSAFFLLLHPISNTEKAPRHDALARGSSGKTRTYNPSVNSRMLCH